MTRDPVTIITFDNVPDFARGLVRDIRPRWAAHEAGIPYRVETVPGHPRSAAHLAMQPFHQVPMLKDGDLTLFESGAIVLHLAEGSALMPAGQRAQVTQWVIAALNSVEPEVMAWVTAQHFDKDPAAAERANTRLQPRLSQLSAVLEGKDWLLAGRFTAADLMMVETLRGISTQAVMQDHGILLDYIARATARPAFEAAMADHMAHWQAADAAMEAAE